MDRKTKVCGLFWHFCRNFARRIKILEKRKCFKRCVDNSYFRNDFWCTCKIFLLPIFTLIKKIPARMFHNALENHFRNPNPTIFNRGGNLLLCGSSAKLSRSAREKSTVSFRIITFCYIWFIRNVFLTLSVMKKFISY